MTEHQILDNTGPAGGIFVNNEAQTALHKAANWSLFLAIMGFIGIGFMVLAAIAMMVMGGLAGSELSSAELPFPFWILSLFYLVFAALYFFPVLFLYRFSDSTKRALRSQSVDEITRAFVSLGNHYQWTGIMVISIIALYILFIIGMVVFMGTMGGGF